MTTAPPTTDSDLTGLPIFSIQLDFESLRASYVESYRTTWLSLGRNVAFFRKYLNFKETRRFPTNLQLKRKEFNYSTSWDQGQLAEIRSVAGG